MRILFIGSWYPYPLDNGARIRTYNLVKQLSRYHDVSLLSFYEGTGPFDSARLDAMCPFCSRVEAIPRLTFSGYSPSSVLEILRLRPPWITLRWNPAMSRRVHEIMRSKCFDLVVISQVQNLPLLDAIDSRKPLLLEQFEVGRVWERVQYASGGKRVRRVLSRALWAQYLRQRLPRFAGVTVPSVGEQAILSSICSSTNAVELIPNGVDLDHYRLGLEKPEAGVLIYQGSLAFDANYDAVRYFMLDVMPLVSDTCPGVRLRVTGSSEGIDATAIAANSGLELTGYLDDVRGAIASAWICIVPLRLGSGSRLKVIEAMALGTPVVATSKGIEGLEVVPGEHALVANDPPQLAQHVIRLLGDPALRARLAANGRRLVEERYGWDRIGARLNVFCEQIAQCKR